MKSHDSPAPRSPGKEPDLFCKSGLPARTKREDGTTLVATALERICSQRAAHQANESFKPTPLRGVVQVLLIFTYTTPQIGAA